MAPGHEYRCGASGVGGGEKMDPVMSSKATNDAAALARSLANARGRNVQWAEKAVRESVSITAEEALRQNVIDFVAADLSEVLRRIDGTRVKVANGEVQLQTAPGASAGTPDEPVREHSDGVGRSQHRLHFVHAG
jgi:membrane-bound serine protease (ClpP class)